MKAAEEEYNAHKQNMPAKLQMAYSTIAKMEAQINCLQSRVERLEKENQELMQALKTMLDFSDTWGREWFSNEQWGKIDNAKTVYSNALKED